MSKADTREMQRIELAELERGVSQLSEAFRAILESMVDGVVVIDAHGSIQRVNPALAGLLGFEAEALVGQPFDAILAPTEHELTAQLPAVVPAGEFRDRDILFATASGESITMAVNGSSLRDQDGRLIGVVLVARDD